MSTDPDLLRERAIDSWALALLRRERGEAPGPPAAVVFPSSTQDVAAVLAWASRTGTAVVPRGGGSGVCGGAQAGAGSVVLDLSRMNAVTGVDLVSQAVDVQAGVRGDQLEDALAPHGLTVGHYPQSLAISTVGGWIAASSAGQASTGFGAIEDVLLGLTAVLADGAVLRCGPVPRSAAGPDLRRLLVGSEGTLAVITEATLACRARPAGWQWLAFLRSCRPSSAGPERTCCARSRPRSTRATCSTRRCSAHEQPGHDQPVRPACRHRELEGTPGQDRGDRAGAR